MEKHLCCAALFTPRIQFTFLINFHLPLRPPNQVFQGVVNNFRTSGHKLLVQALGCPSLLWPRNKGLYPGELTQHFPAPPWPLVPKRVSKPLLCGAAFPTTQDAQGRTLRSSGSYLKHVVSSPEGFRHGYLVVAILFSEQTSLRKSWRGNVVDSPRSAAGSALGEP